jgi:hypothetical protein
LTKPFSLSRGTRPIPPQLLQMKFRSELQGDGFYFCVFVQGVLAQFAAHAGLLEASEGVSGIEDVLAVDPDCSRPHAVGYSVRFLDVAGPDAGC